MASLAFFLCVITCMISAVPLLRNVNDYFSFKQVADPPVSDIDSESWFMRCIFESTSVYQDNVMTASHSIDSSVSDQFPSKQTANVTVAIDGSGKFTSLGAALAVAPKRSKRWFVIYIKAGVYHQNVTVQNNQTNIVLLGDGVNQTVITASHSNASGIGTLYSATVGKYFFLSCIHCAPSFVKQCLLWANWDEPRVELGSQPEGHEL